MRVLDERGVSVKDVALRRGISKEAVVMATTFLAKHGYVVVEEKTVRLTTLGCEAQERADRLHGEIGEAWSTPLAGQLRAALAPHYPMVLHRGGWPDGS